MGNNVVSAKFENRDFWGGEKSARKTGLFPLCLRNLNTGQNTGQRVKKEEFLNFTSFLITCLNIPLLNLKQH